MNFEIFNLKALSDGNTYNLNDPVEKKKYFNVKAGRQIEELKTFLEKNTFIAFMLSKKGAGKGTYTNTFQELMGADKVANISIGDLVRDTHKSLTEGGKEAENALIDYLKDNYRGTLTPQECIDSLLGRNQSTLLPTEFILSIAKKAVKEQGRKAIFMDGFPRNMDQVSYSLYFRDLINFRDDPDLFVFIDVPESVIEERIKSRVICPKCKASRNTKLLVTKFPVYDKETGEYHLLCDNTSCEGFGKEKMIAKEGDSLGIAPIKDRLDLDGKIMEYSSNLNGISKVFVRNSIPVSVVSEYVEEYEITPEYVLSGEGDNITVTEKPWIVKDDNGEDCQSLLAPAGLVSFIHQLHKALL